MRSARTQIDFGLRVEKAQRTGTGFVVHPHDEVDGLEGGRAAILLPRLRMGTPDHAFTPRIRCGILQRMKKHLLRMLDTQDRQQIGRQGEEARILQSPLVVAERTTLTAAQMQPPDDLAAGPQMHLEIPTSGWRDRHMPVRQEAGLERVMGIEPTLEAWEAAVLPLNYTRIEEDR